MDDAAFRDGSVRRIAWPDCEDWLVSGDELRHRSGRYFSLCIVADAHGRERLMIAQPEVGLLGFLMRECNGRREWLLQDKAEPGNIGGFQWAPSVQATRSNYERVHGGRPTPLLDEMTRGEGGAVDVEQSEQGGQFIGKFNRNRKVCLAPDAEPEIPAGYRWVDSATLRDCLRLDFSVNTDARSVLASGEWRLLADDAAAPFSRPVIDTRWSNAFAASLAQCDATRLAAATALLAAVAARQPPPSRPMAFQSSRQFRLRRDAITNASGDEVAAFFHASLPTREVPQWCQPMLLRRQVHSHALLFDVVAGIARFRLTAYAEPGFLGRAEFGPTLQAGDSPGMLPDAQVRDLVAGCDTVLSIRQSDEGGRFFQQVGDYTIAHSAGDDAFPDHAGLSLTLGEIQALSARRGRLTNELRTLLSLLLSAI